MNNTHSPNQSFLKECDLHWRHLISMNLRGIFKYKTRFIICIPPQYHRDSYFCKNAGNGHTYDLQISMQKEKEENNPESEKQR